MSENKKLAASEAIQAMNKGKIVGGDTSDGRIEARKLNKTTYEIRVFTDGVSEPEIALGNIQNVLKTFNKEPFRSSMFIKH